MEEKKYSKVMFKLTRDEDGYPPDDWERLWAWQVASNMYCIDNLPFYIKGISSGDLVSVEQKDNELHFKELLQASSNSVFRIYVFRESEVQAVRNELRDLRCESELSNIPNLLSVEVPGDVPIKPFLDLLMRGAESKRWDFQEAALRHVV